MSETIVLSLISHTNIGKTTLTRTLLRRDVGEVRDEAHVTVDSARYQMLAAGDDRLMIWDTPGFGPVEKLHKRLLQEGGSWGWLMHEVVDRVFNRGLYSSLEAAKNVRAEADVVLYLVNATESPSDAGYVAGELRLLDALNKPVLLILNQVADTRLKDAEPLRQEWRNHYAQHPCLKDVLLLDAFLRSWLQEVKLLDAVKPHLPDNKQKALTRLRARYLEERRAQFDKSARAAADILWLAAHQKRGESGKDPKVLFTGFVQELQDKLDDFLELLVQQQGLETEDRARLETDIAMMSDLASDTFKPKETGLIAGALSGAGAGLAADALSGGLTLGGGMILGFLGGYLGGFSFARVVNFFSSGEQPVWKEEVLAQFYQLLLSYYLLAALHGRGKGKLTLAEPIPALAQVLADLAHERKDEVLHLVRACRKPEADQAQWRNQFQSSFAASVDRVLERLSLAS